MIERLRGWASWVLIPALLVMQFFDLRRALFGPGWVWSCFLIGFAVLTVVLLPLAASNLRDLRGPLGWVTGLFTVVIGYALVSALVSPPPWLTGPPYADPKSAWVRPTTTLRVVPLVTAWFAMTAGVLSVLVIPRAKRVNRLWWAAATIVLSSLIAWPRSVLNTDSTRLATGMGGAATVHLVLLLCCGLFTGAAFAGMYRRASLLGAALAAACVVFTGSRSGLICLAAFVALIAIWLAGRVSGRVVAFVIGGGVALLAVVMLIAPQARRIFILSDDLRSANLRTGFRVLNESWQHWIFGAGSGRLWPWYAYDARFFRVPWRGIVTNHQGKSLTNPHSVPLGALVELGLIGLALVVALMAVLVVHLVRRWSAVQRDPLGFTRRAVTDLALVAVVAGLIAFLFDFYLFKNFAVNYWWWAVVALVLGAAARPDDAPTQAPRDTADQPSEVS